MQNSEQVYIDVTNQFKSKIHSTYNSKGMQDHSKGQTHSLTSLEQNR